MLKGYGKRTDLTDLQKVEELQKLYASSNYKTDINVPSDIQYVKGFNENGTVKYDWPERFGFDHVESITRDNGLPEAWDRYGYMVGSNFADIRQRVSTHTVKGRSHMLKMRQRIM